MDQHRRRKRQKLDGPITVYEMHLGSWMCIPEEQIAG